MPYDTGIATKKAILAVSEKLILEKGFRETGYADICAAAHVNRNTVNYHFGNKEKIRDAIIWDQYERNRLLAARYCDDPSVCYLLSIYMIWRHICMNPKIRRFLADYTADHPVYNPKAIMAKTYKITYQEGFNLDANRKFAPFAFSTVYGYITALIQLVCAHPERYNGRDVFTNGSMACLKAWNVPEEQYGPQWDKVEYYMDLIPLSEIDALCG